MKLYTYFRSSAAYRVRIAMNLKGVAAEQISIHLTKDGGAEDMPRATALERGDRCGGDERTAKDRAKFEPNWHS